MYGVERVVNPREGESLFDSQLVQGSIIDHHTKRPVFLVHKKNWGSDW
jgi:hypothetical protein